MCSDVSVGDDLVELLAVVVESVRAVDLQVGDVELIQLIEQVDVAFVGYGREGARLSLCSSDTYGFRIY